MSDKDRQKLLAAALRRQQTLKMNQCIDPADLDSRPSEKQEHVLREVSKLHVYVVAGNQSGKSQLGGRVVAWKFLETHPHWERSPEWGNEPLLIIVSGRLGDQVEELWERKIKPYLPPGSYNKPKYSSGSIKSVTHATNGNKILFTSHDKANQAWEKIQSYVAHHVWIDEMPSHAKYVEEAAVRVDAKRGQLMLTMTPKTRNDEIKNMVDNSDRDIAIKYQMGMLDNPKYFGREEEIIKGTAHMSPEQRNAKLYGDWIGGDDSVFEFERSRHVLPLPSNYSTGWPHVLGFDPAPNGIGGLVILAGDPQSDNWWVVRSEYIKGKAPSDLVTEVQDIAKKYNIVRKVYDSHEPWFHHEAVKQGFSGWIAVDKHSRKKELITGLQQALLDNWLLCIDMQEEMFREFNNAEWLDGDQAKIRNSTKYHLLDALQYIIDNLPNKPEERVKLTVHQEIMKKHMEEQLAQQKLREAAEQQKRTGRRQFVVSRGKSNRWRR